MSESSGSDRPDLVDEDEPLVGDAAADADAAVHGGDVGGGSVGPDLIDRMTTTDPGLETEEGVDTDGAAVGDADADADASQHGGQRNT